MYICMYVYVFMLAGTLQQYKITLEMNSGLAAPSIPIFIRVSGLCIFCRKVQSNHGSDLMRREGLKWCLLLLCSYFGGWGGTCSWHLIKSLKPSWALGLTWQLRSLWDVPWGSECLYYYYSSACFLMWFLGASRKLCSLDFQWAQRPQGNIQKRECYYNKTYTTTILIVKR